MGVLYKARDPRRPHGVAAVTRAPLGGLLYKGLDLHRRALGGGALGALGLSVSSTTRGNRPSLLLSLHRAVEQTDYKKKLSESSKNKVTKKLGLAIRQKRLSRRRHLLRSWTAGHFVSLGRSAHSASTHWYSR